MAVYLPRPSSQTERLCDKGISQVAGACSGGGLESDWPPQVPLHYINLW